MLVTTILGVELISSAGLLVNISLDNSGLSISVRQDSLKALPKRGRGRLENT